MRHIILAAALAAAVAAPVDAAVLFTLERFSDTTVRVRGSGSPDKGLGGDQTSANFSNLSLKDVIARIAIVGAAQGEVRQISGDFAFANPQSNFGIDPSGSGDLLTRYTFQDNTAPSGTAFWEIAAPPLSFNAEWSLIGTSGDLIADYFDGAFTTQDVVVGRWEMVAPIPLPAAAWLLLGGVGALGAVARKRRAA